jgi:hypothetical protein
VEFCVPLPQHFTHFVQNYFKGSNGWMLQRARGVQKETELFK